MLHSSLTLIDKKLLSNVSPRSAIKSRTPLRNLNTNTTTSPTKMIQNYLTEDLKHTEKSLQPETIGHYQYKIMLYQEVAQNTLLVHL